MEKKQPIFYTNEELKSIALQFTNMKSLTLANPSAAGQLYRRKLTKEYCSHMNPLVVHNKYTLKGMIQLGKKYKTISGFQKYQYNAYAACSKKGWIDKVCGHMTRKIRKDLSKKELLKIAKKYNRRVDLQEQDKSAYILIRRRGFLEEACQHMQPSASKKRDFQELQKIALQYKHPVEFEKYNRNAYYALQKRGLLQEACKHMTHSISLPEKEAFEFIKSNYPSAIKKKFHNIKIPRRPYIKGFEIDILIPELNKGIEIDGVYFHSKKMLEKRTSRNWSKKATHEYHKIKDDYFINNHNIQILHITDIEWNKDRINTEKRILDFLTS